MAERYKHIQKGGIWFYLCILGLILCVFSYLGIFIYLLNAPEGNTGFWISIIILIFTSCLLTWAMMVMSSFTVYINEHFLMARFGGGSFKKRYKIDDIVSCEPVRNDWWWGWGIRYYGEGWLYNIDGLDAVEIILKTGKKARIGTDEPEQLTQAIKSACRSNGQTHID